MKKQVKTAGALALAFLFAATLFCAAAGIWILTDLAGSGLTDALNAVDAPENPEHPGQEVAEEVVGKALFVLLAAVFLALIGPALLITGFLLLIFSVTVAVSFSRRMKGTPAGGAETFAIVAGALYAVWGVVVICFSFTLVPGIIAGILVSAAGVLTIVYAALCKKNLPEVPDDGYYNLPPGGGYPGFPPDDPGLTEIPEEDSGEPRYYEPPYCWGSNKNGDPF